MTKFELLDLFSDTHANLESLRKVESRLAAAKEFFTLNEETVTYLLGVDVKETTERLMQAQCHVQSILKDLENIYWGDVLEAVEESWADEAAKEAV